MTELRSWVFLIGGKCMGKKGGEKGDWPLRQEWQRRRETREREKQTDRRKQRKRDGRWTGPF